jgi:RNA polymerase sigma factor (sigma-70 family)
MTGSVNPSQILNYSRQDERLVQDCLQGNPEAWAALIEKYKNLIFSIPIKYGFSPEEATDIFQEVCLGLLTDLPQLREPRALAAWIIQITSHKCFRWKRERGRYVETESEGETADKPSNMPDKILSEVEREQTIRETLAEVPPHCKRLIDLLFFESPALPYDQVAKLMGLSKGSIGAIRMRCLERFRRRLERKRFR